MYCGEAAKDCSPRMFRFDISPLQPTGLGMVLRLHEFFLTGFSLRSRGLDAKHSRVVAVEMCLFAGAAQHRLTRLGGNRCAEETARVGSER
jgi:hypothetical protein